MCHYIVEKAWYKCCLTDYIGHAWVNVPYSSCLHATGLQLLCHAGGELPVVCPLCPRHFLCCPKVRLYDIGQLWADVSMQITKLHIQPISLLKSPLCTLHIACNVILCRRKLQDNQHAWLVVLWFPCIIQTTVCLTICCVAKCRAP